MKVERQLSEDEYIVMKNKLISSLTGSIISTEPLTNKTEEEVSNNKVQEESGLTGKLEQLHKMKEEGKLSEGDYLMMKNKVMSALSG